MRSESPEVAAGPFAAAFEGPAAGAWAQAGPREPPGELSKPSLRCTSEGRMAEAASGAVGGVLGMPW
jgi:hypothetical protein